MTRPFPPPAPHPAPHSAPVSLRALLLAALGGLCAMTILGPAIPSRDLMALWLAAQEVAAGHPAGIYPPLETIFSMRPPLDWYPKAAALGREGGVFPYLYPPLWAWLLAPLTRVLSFQVFATAILGLNVTVLALTPVLAARIALARPLSARGQGLWWAGTIAAMLLAHGLLIGLFEGQPQIVVAGLVLLGLERTQHGHPVAGGVAMGLAIALKLAPLPLALLWLASGQRRAGGTALALAAGLGLVSVGLAGWPLHRVFLAQVQGIDHTALLVAATASFDTLFSAACCAHQGQLIPTLPPEIGPSVSGWVVLGKSAPWAMAQKALLLAGMIGFALALRLRRNQGQQAALWAAAMAWLAFFGPIGWLYYYIAPLSLLGLLPLRLGWRGTVLALTIVGCLASDLLLRLSGLSFRAATLMPSMGILLLICAWLWAAFRPGPENHGPAPQTRLRRAVT